MALHTYLTQTDLVSIVLAGSFEKELGDNPEKMSLVYDDLQTQMVRVFLKAQNIPLIKENYHIVTAGAFPYSREISKVFWRLQEVRAVTRIMGESGDIVKPLALASGRDALKRRYISDSDYEKVKDIGQNLRIMRAIKI
jgi:hypothetical protein